MELNLKSLVMISLLFLAICVSIICQTGLKPLIRSLSLLTVTHTNIDQPIRSEFKFSQCELAGSKGYWKKTNRNILPLHDFPFQCAFNPTLKDYSYFNDAGVKRHMSKHGLVSFDSKHLKYTWHSNACNLTIFNSSHRQLFEQSKLWIHFEGDSVTRSMYNDLKNYFYPCSVRDYLEEGDLFKLKNVSVSFTNNNFMLLRENCSIFDFSHLKNGIKKNPDVLIVNFGHWYSRYEDEKKLSINYSDLMKCMNSNGRYLGKTLKIFRLTTPIRLQKWKERPKWMNEIALKYLDKSQWHILDFFPMLQERLVVLSPDLVHFPIVGSNWMVNIILNIINDLLIK